MPDVVNNNSVNVVIIYSFFCFFFLVPTWPRNSRLNFYRYIRILPGACNFFLVTTECQKALSRVVSLWCRGILEYFTWTPLVKSRRALVKQHNCGSSPAFRNTALHVGVLKSRAEKQICTPPWFAPWFAQWFAPRLLCLLSTQACAIFWAHSHIFMCLFGSGIGDKESLDGLLDSKRACKLQTYKM